MALVRPFRGYRYRTDGTDITTFTAPPYDVVNEPERKAFIRKNPHNAVALELGAGALDPDAPGNRYETTRERWHSWMDDGIVEREETPAIYVIEQRFTWAGEPHSRTSFIVETQLRGFDEQVILPHEHTLPKALDDRYHLTQATQANFSPVFCLFAGGVTQWESLCTRMKAGEVTSSATDADGVLSRMWAVTDETLIAEFVELVSDKQFFIADGHHRYTIALKIRDEEREHRYGVPATEAPSLPDFDADAGSEYVMMAVTSMDDPQLLVLPYHRAVKAGARADLAKHIIDNLDRDFDVREGDEGDLTACTRPAFLYEAHDGRCGLAELKESVDVDTAIDDEHCSDWKHLDVSVLQELVIEPYADITYRKPDTVQHLAFTHSADAMREGVRTGRYDMIFLMRPVAMSQLRAVSLAGNTMPQKSTYFYPKLPSGMVYRSID